MRDHSFEVDHTSSQISFASTFNVAVSFIDRHRGEGRADKAAIRTAAESVTYGQLADRVNRCGNALADLGIAPGERMLMIVKDCPAFVYLFWGAIKAGIIPVPLNTLLRAADYQYMIDDSACAALVYSPEYEREVSGALAAASHRPAQVLLTEAADGSLARRMQAADQSLDPVPTQAEDECFWLYSSGSTGRPKGAVHAHRDMVVTSTWYGMKTLGMREDDVCFSAAKLFFAYGLGNAMTFPLLAGATAVLSDQRPSPAMTFEIIETCKPTLYFGVPTLYAAQLQALETATPDLGSLRLCVSAGEALPADLYHRWKDRTGLTILDGIGSTEGLHIFVSNREDDVSPGTSGRVVPGYQAKIAGEDGRTVKPGDTGILLIKGDSTASHYWNNPERTAAAMIDGWLNTGDSYLQTEDGYYQYCGRTDDMMKVGGIWCSPFEIEACLVSHDKVLEAAVIGRQDEESLTKPAAYIVLKDPADASDALKQDLLEHCKRTLAPYKYPRWIAFEAEFPKTATGKIQRFKLRQRSA